jgi:predicted aconitase with swiveling domain
MSELVLTARHAMGHKVSGEALVAKDGFSARYDLNRLRGVFSRPTHKLAGQSYVGRILVLDTAKGGVASAWMLNEMQSRDMVPLAIVFNSVNPILVQGAALGGISMLAGFDEDITASVPHGAMVEIDPSAKTLRVFGIAERPVDAEPHAAGTSATAGAAGEAQKVRFVNPR